MQLWDVPPGVPSDIDPSVYAAPPALEDPPRAEHGPRNRNWAQRAILPDRVIAAFTPRRPQNEDPFLVTPAKTEGTRSILGPLAKGSDAKLPGTGFRVIPRMPNPFSSSADTFTPPPIARRDPNSDQTPLIHQYDSLRDRLLAALASDRRLDQPAHPGEETQETARRRVESLMDQARGDLDEGRLASAYRTAQSAEAIATESEIVLGDGRQEPAELVRVLREKLSDDVGHTTELPPERSVENEDGPTIPEAFPNLDPESGDSSEPLPVSDEGTPGATRVGDAAPALTGPSVAAAPVSESPLGPVEPRPLPVEVLPAAPLSPSEPDNHLEMPASSEPIPPRRSLDRSTALAEIVGPSSPVDGAPHGPSFDSPSAPVATEVASVETTQPFLPDRSGSATQSAETGPQPSPVEPTAPRADSGARSTAEARNVAWSETPEAARIVPQPGLSRPLLAGLGIAAAWIAGLVLMRVARVLRLRSAR